MKSSVTGFFNASAIKFYLVGGVSAALSISLFYVMVERVRIPYLLAYLLIFISINACAYVASRRFVFVETKVSVHGGLMRYFGVAVFSLAINALILYLQVDVLGLHPVVASLVLSVLNAPLNFLLHRIVTFRVKVGEGK